LLCVGDLRHDRSCGRFRRHCRLGQTPSRLPAAFLGVSSRLPASAGSGPSLNRIDSILFGRCFNSWIAALWPDRHEFIAIDGKTSRPTHDQRKGLKPCIRQVYATNAG